MMVLGTGKRKEKGAAPWLLCNENVGAHAANGDGTSVSDGRQLLCAAQLNTCWAAG